jgi:hypothetical protein
MDSNLTMDALIWGDLEKASNVAYEDVLREFDSV